MSSKIARKGTEGSFDVDVGCAPQVVVKFTAAWCPPCHALTPTLDAVVGAAPDVALVEVDVDDEPGLAARFGVRGMPTLIVFRNGAPVGQLVGNQPRARIEQLLRETRAG